MALPSRSSGTLVKLPSPKDLRERIFKKSKPQARVLEIFNGDSYSKDLGILWAAYKAGSFMMEEGLTQEAFVDQIEQILSAYQHVWLIDDDNTSFSSGRGPVALIGANTIDLIVEPRALFFKWATKRNILRASISYLNMLKHSSKTGIVLVRTEKTKRVLPDHLKKYDMLYYLGKQNNNEYLYHVRGRGSD